MQYTIHTYKLQPRYVPVLYHSHSHGRSQVLIYRLYVPELHHSHTNGMSKLFLRLIHVYETRPSPIGLIQQYADVPSLLGTRNSPITQNCHGPSEATDSPCHSWLSSFLEMPAPRSQFSDPGSPRLAPPGGTPRASR